MVRDEHQIFGIVWHGMVQSVLDVGFKYIIQEWKVICRTVGIVAVQGRIVKGQQVRYQQMKSLNLTGEVVLEGQQQQRCSSIFQHQIQHVDVE